MKRISILTALTIMLAGGIASADHGRHRGHWNRGGWSGGFSAGVVVRTPAIRVVQPRVVVVHRPRVVQRPVVVVQAQPTYVEPATYVPPPPPPQPQVWIEARWSWNGYGWQWIEGHYEVQQAAYPQPAYNEPCDY
jgi:hypothetical protein